MGLLVYFISFSIVNLISKIYSHESKFSEEKSNEGIGSYFSKSMAFFSQGEYSIVHGITFMPFSAERELQEIANIDLQTILLDSASNTRNTISIEEDHQIISLDLRNLEAANNEKLLAQDDEDESLASFIFSDEDNRESEDESAPSVILSDEDISADQIDYSVEQTHSDNHLSWQDEYSGGSSIQYSDQDD